MGEDNSRRSGAPADLTGDAVAGGVPAGSMSGLSAAMTTQAHGLATRPGELDRAAAGAAAFQKGDAHAGARGFQPQAQHGCGSLPRGAPGAEQHAPVCDHARRRVADDGFRAAASAAPRRAPHRRRLNRVPARKPTAAARHSRQPSARARFPAMRVPAQRAATAVPPIRTSVPLLRVSAQRAPASTGIARRCRNGETRISIRPVRGQPLPGSCSSSAANPVDSPSRCAALEPRQIAGCSSKRASFGSPAAIAAHEQSAVEPLAANEGDAHCARSHQACFNAPVAPPPPRSPR